ncbi:MAG TPA: HNH endonuclease [Pyrinomonadaceae bacterium]|jgi:hypothetical protein
MACSRGKANPNAFTVKKLFANSGGYCQNLNCNENLFKELEENEIHIAEIAHIISVNEGARKNDKLSDEEKGNYDNLILLCPNCHTTIDKAEESFPEKLIFKWKNEHKARLAATFGIRRYELREQVRKVLRPIFAENKMIFDKYGPNTDERYNPESDMPTLWRRKIREFIIPNNRKILNIIIANYDFLNDDECSLFEEFKQHLDDFEKKHLYGEESSGLQFPKRISDIYV